MASQNSNMESGHKGAQCPEGDWHWLRRVLPPGNQPVAETVRFTRHARNRMRWRRLRLLKEEDVRAALASPDHTEPDEKHPDRHNAWKRLGKMWLRVTYRTDRRGITVITITVRNRGPKT